MYDKRTYKEMLCPVCGEFYFSKLDSEEDVPEFFSRLKDSVGIQESVPQCHRCGWKYDLDQLNNKDERQGENELPFNEYVKWYTDKLKSNPNYYYLEANYSPLSHICPVCNKHKFKDVGTFEICPVCGWIDDPVMTDDPDFEGGANELSLNSYKNQYISGKKQK